MTQTYTCVSPNVTSVLSTDDHIHATVSLISSDLGLPVSTSFPFMFKQVPSVQSISPNIGSINGGTSVKVVGKGPGMWANSSDMLSCYFGREEIKAVYISSLEVNCVSPPGYYEVNVTVSDNNVDLSESKEIFSFQEDSAVITMEQVSHLPSIAILEPQFGVAEETVNVTVLGSNLAEEKFTNLLYTARS